MDHLYILHTEMEPKEEELLHAKFERTLKFGSDNVNFKGEFVYCWPYVWDNKTDWILIERLESKLADWLKVLMPWKAVEMKTIRTSVIGAMYTSPSSWRHTGAEDEIALAKLLLHTKMQAVFFLIDDSTEDESESESHTIYVRSVAGIITKILQYRFVTFEEVKADPLYTTVVDTSKDCGSYLELLFDCAQDAKHNFGVTAELGQFFARLTGYLFALQNWCDSKGMSHLLNRGLRIHLRNYTGGFCALVEWVLLLDHIHVPRIIRDNVYWARCLEMVGFLVGRNNDIIGIEKEWLEQKQKGKRLDNAVLLDMEITGCTFEKALTKALGEHNVAVKEFHDLVKFLKDNPFLTHELSEAEKVIFFRSIFVMGEFIGSSLQAQVLMPRYNNDGLKLTFESSKTIYGISSETAEAPQ